MLSFALWSLATLPTTVNEREKRSFVYRRRNLTNEQFRNFESAGRPHVVRFVMPLKEQRFRDVVLDKDIVMPADEAQEQ